MATRAAWADCLAAISRCASSSARDPRIRALASRLARLGVPLAPLARCALLLAAVQSRVTYEEGAPFLWPVPTWHRGKGDCKSSACLLGALALSLGFGVRFAMVGSGDALHVACQLRPSPGSPWLWAETTLAARLGEPPYVALRRLEPVGRPDLGARRERLRRVGRVRSGVLRSGMTAEAHAYAGHVIAQAFERVVGRAPSLFERQMLQAVGLTETSYGRGWKPPCENSRNWGSVHAKGGAPSCSYTDSFPDGTRYEQEMRVYPTDVDGAADVVSLIYNHMQGVRRVLETGGGIRAFSRQMIYSHYAGSICPKAVAKYGSAAVHDATMFWPVIPLHLATTEAGKACEEEAIALHASVMTRAANEIADALHEPRPPVGPSGGSSSWLAPAIAGALVLGAGGVVYLAATRPPKKLGAKGAAS